MRARNLKPSIFKNEHLAKLGPWHFVLFTGLWCLADRKGRLEDRPGRIEAELFPFKFQQIDTEKLLTELSTGEEPFILRYEVNEKRYVQIVNFEKHQRPHINESDSVIPAQPRYKVGTTKGMSTCHQGVLTPDSPSLTPDSPSLTPDSPSLTPDSPILNPDKDKDSPAKDAGAVVVPVVLNSSEVKPKTPQAAFVERFKASYESMTGQPYKRKDEHFVIAARLIKDYGIDQVVTKVKILGALCRDKSAWFTRGGWSDFSIEKLSSQWNAIIPEARIESPTEKAEREKAEIEAKVRETNERLGKAMGRR